MGNPQICVCGNPLVGGRIVVSFMRCRCEHAQGGGCDLVQCRVCGAASWPDGHTDDSKLLWPVPKLPDAIRMEPL